MFKSNAPTNKHIKDTCSIISNKIHIQYKELECSVRLKRCRINLMFAHATYLSELRDADSWIMAQMVKITKVRNGMVKYITMSLVTLQAARLNKVDATRLNKVDATSMRAEKLIAEISENLLSITLKSSIITITSTCLVFYISMGTFFGQVFK